MKRTTLTSPPPNGTAAADSGLAFGEHVAGIGAVRSLEDFMLSEALSRRRFLSILLAATPAPLALGDRLDCVRRFGGGILHGLADAGNGPDGRLGECAECRGLGAVICPACDGTGRWTEPSESAGLYRREAARSLGHCAWCNESGEASCSKCEGSGSELRGEANG